MRCAKKYRTELSAAARTGSRDPEIRTLDIRVALSTGEAVRDLLLGKRGFSRPTNLAPVAQPVPVFRVVPATCTPSSLLRRDEYQPMGMIGVWAFVTEPSPVDRVGRRREGNALIKPFECPRNGAESTSGIRPELPRPIFGF